MKLIVAFLVLIFYNVSNTLALETDVPYKINNAATLAYSPGEFLEYKVSYGFYTAAYATLSVTDSVVQGVRTNHVVAKAETIGFSDYLFSIRDKYESFINPLTDLPILSIRNLKEGRYKHYNEVTYNRNSSTATSMKNGIFSIPKNIQDILSVFYYARRFDFNDNLKVNQTLIYQTFFSDKVFEIIIQYRGIETVVTEAGIFNCYKFTMCERNGETIKTQDNLNFWVTRDENRIPVKVEFEILVGSFVVELSNYSGLRNPLL